MLQFPETFDGRFYFTNFSDEEFSTKWDGVIYTFPAHKTSPLIIPNEPATNIQNIRKKFARDLAEREFYKSEKFKRMNSEVPVGQGSGLHATVTYTEDELTPFIQQCLEELPLESPKVKAEAKKDIPLRTNEKGKTVSKVIEESDSLVGEGTVVA